VVIVSVGAVGSVLVVLVVREVAVAVDEVEVPEVSANAAVSPPVPALMVERIWELRNTVEARARIRTRTIATINIRRSLFCISLPVDCFTST
jgi:hypothetical protein